VKQPHATSLEGETAPGHVKIQMAMDGRQDKRTGTFMGSTVDTKNDLNIELRLFSVDTLI
jgi:hypothetical protein